MIISWNTWGLNKVGKTIEIGSWLRCLGPTISILLETRVKHNKAESVRKKLDLKYQYLDNYDYHLNGRIWLLQDDTKVEIKPISCTSQLLHCGVFDLRGNFLNWITSIYAMNSLEERKSLRQDTERISHQQQGPWCLLGDFKNVLHPQDRVRGRFVTKTEYMDLRSMMERVGLFEMDNAGQFFTYSNKQVDNINYSRIDRVIRNISWLQNNINTVTPF